MAGTVRFYSMGIEEYERLRNAMGQGVDGAEEAEERRQTLDEDGIYFVEDRKAANDAIQ